MQRPNSGMYSIVNKPEWTCADCLKAHHRCVRCKTMLPEDAFDISLVVTIVAEVLLLRCANSCVDIMLARVVGSYIV